MTVPWLKRQYRERGGWEVDRAQVTEDLQQVKEGHKEGHCRPVIWRTRSGNTLQRKCSCDGLVPKACLTLATPWTVACQAPLSMGFSRQEYWSGLPFPSLGDLPNPRIEPGSPSL